MGKVPRMLRLVGLPDRLKDRVYSTTNSAKSKGAAREKNRFVKTVEKPKSHSRKFWLPKVDFFTGLAFSTRL
ncbi:MAG: hypothetical protein IKN72_08765 [Clostridia bacterium]|nr:hypothetical protein [Clostridia bacterium]